MRTTRKNWTRQRKVTRDWRRKMMKKKGKAKLLRLIAAFSNSRALRFSEKSAGESFT